ncbi:fibronectin type III domain-containing protein [Kordia jejudonensis]|uniref:fibronectin type III domain-containing protein n=1 Tax=Kordia jejudonensis TaxID=1348245 RepID=UPI00062980E9|nr:fibronectin type III domain-containing protein [Kordia jejudonensis]
MKKYIYIILLATVFTSCSDIIEVVDISDTNVQLVAPSDNSTLNLTTLTLSWDSVADAENYQIQIAQPDFENLLQLVADSTLTANSYTVTLEAGTSYQWRVRAKNSDYTTSYSKYTFTLE